MFHIDDGDQQKDARYQEGRQEVGWRGIGEIEKHPDGQHGRFDDRGASRPGPTTVGTTKTAQGSDQSGPTRRWPRCTAILAADALQTPGDWKAVGERVDHNTCEETQDRDEKDHRR